MDIVLYGIVQSAQLMLVASGFSLVYGVSRLPNFAHGALYVLAGYLAWVLLEEAGLPYALAAPLAVLGTALLGALLYRLVLRRIRGMELAEVIGTFAIGIAILEALREHGLSGDSHTLPVVAEGAVEVFGVPIDYQRVFIVLVALAVVVALRLFTHGTRLGRAMRGVAQDERAAMMLGIDSDRTATLAVALGAALAAVAALALLPLSSVDVQEGDSVLIYALAVCVVGGLGSWRGMVLASLLLGFSQYVVVAYGKPHFKVVVMLLAIVLTVIARPSGLFGRQKALEERV